jgi:hypothetical protein
LASPSGDPLVVTTPLGSGRVVLVATAGSLASVDAATGEPWTAWPAWPSFLPIVREILGYAVGGDRAESQLTVGTPLGASLEQGAVAESLELTRPDGRTTAVHATTATSARRWAYADTDLSGIYSVRDSISGDVQHFAVNVDTRESDLAQVEKGVRTIFPLGSSGGIGATSRKIVLTPFSGAAWHRPLLWTALALVFVELCLAWLFGRGGT